MGVAFHGARMAGAAIDGRRVAGIAVNSKVIWTSEALSTVVPMGIVKNNNNQTMGGNNWNRVVGLVALGGYPDTVIDDDGIVVEGSGLVTINARVTFNNPNQFKGVRVLVNDDVVLENEETTTDNNVDVSGEVTLAEGDVVHLEGHSAGTTVNARINGGSDTWMYWDNN